MWVIWENVKCKSAEWIQIQILNPVGAFVDDAVITDVALEADEIGSGFVYVVIVVEVGGGSSVVILDVVVIDCRGWFSIQNIFTLFSTQRFSTEQVLEHDFHGPLKKWPSCVWCVDQEYPHENIARNQSNKGKKLKEGYL